MNLYASRLRMTVSRRVCSSLNVFINQAGKMKNVKITTKILLAFGVQDSNLFSLNVSCFCGITHQGRGEEEGRGSTRRYAVMPAANHTLQSNCSYE